MQKNLPEPRRRLWEKRLSEIKEWAQWLAGELRRRGINVERIMLFGSWARGDFRVDSDADLILLSKDWGRMDYVERLSLLYRLWDKPVDATFVPLTPEEFSTRSERSIVLRDARKYWIELPVPPWDDNDSIPKARPD